MGLGSRRGQKIEGQVPGVGLGSMDIERILKGWRHWCSGFWVGSEGLLRGGIGPRVLTGSEGLVALWSRGLEAYGGSLEGCNWPRAGAGTCVGAGACCCLLLGGAGFCAGICAGGGTSCWVLLGGWVVGGWVANTDGA